MKYLIVDAYNVINQWTNLKEIAKESLEDARDKLVSQIQSYAKLKGYYFIIVFDAYNIDDKISEEGFENGYIVYTEKNQTADSYIEKLVHSIPSIFDVMVVTSDFTLQRMVIAAGAVRISSAELEKDVEYTLKKYMNKTEYDYNEGENNLGTNLDLNTINKLKKLRKGQA